MFLLLIWKGKQGLGSSGKLLLSKKVIDPILEKNNELGDVIENISGIKGKKQKLIKDARQIQGAMGLATNGLINRAQAAEHVIFI